MYTSERFRLFACALRYSFPVLLGYLTIGTAFGLLLVDAGYPWWLALTMSVFMYAGAGQYIAVGLFSAGAGLWEAALVQFVVNARHIAYGLSLFNRINRGGMYRFYLIFGLTDETFALLSSLPAKGEGAPAGYGLPSPDSAGYGRFMFYVTLLDQCYWIAGTLIGAAVGSLIPFNIEGIGFALTALFIVLMIEQMRRTGRPGIFVLSALAALAGVLLLPSRFALLAALTLSLALAPLFGVTGGGRHA
jgi:4-azaleucine resistance transporter AzlC